IHDDKQQPLYSLTQVIDISKQKKAESNLRNTIARFEAILGASTRNMIVGTDTDGLITFYNTGAENLLGYSKEEVLEKHNPSLFHNKEEVMEVATELAKTSGQLFQGFDIFKELVKGDQFSREWTLIKKDGSKLPVQLTITAIRDNNGIIGYLGVGTDISELKRVEKEIKSILKITQSQNDRLKNFAHIVSHNLRSHSGNIEMLLNLFLEENPDVQEDEMMIHLNKASANLKETISHLSEVVLMNVSVRESLTTLNLSKYIRNATENLMALAEKNDVQIVNEVPQKIKVLGIPAYLDSILLNFISNAIKYKASNRKSFVKIRTTVISDNVVLEIEDNGLGIDLKKHRRKLFGMYKTFHSNEDARGIGLFITKNQIEAMGGKIEVESELDKGTTFKIYLKYEKN
ncbi:MAG: PAS domain-containing sensor histidine kinase, partial [Christiangramia sp.]|nr:PAS domain-containing sensor histidine kinase [Christiangramia sp.]